MESKTTETVIIFVNGREIHWNQDSISIEHLIVLAFRSYHTAKRVFTATYKNGPEINREGSVGSEKVAIRPGMVFNITATDRS